MKKLFSFFLLLFLLVVGSSNVFANGQQMIIVNKSNNQLAFYNQGKLEKTFKVATGRENSFTPEGKFKIVNMIKNRPYYTNNIPGGHPSNPLGDRWLGLNARGTYGTTYAIHGNNNPSSIGTYASAGCIRMYNEDIRWLFDRVAVNTPVIITNSKQSFQQIATANGYVFTSKLKNVTVNKTSPQPSKTSIAVTANLDSGTNPVYKFMVHDGKKWTTLRNFSTNNKLTWTPEKSGSYKVKVQVKNKNSKKSFEDEKVLNYVVYTAAKVTTFTTSKSSPQPSNTTINLTAQSNKNTDNLFKFSYYNGTKWVTLQDYSSKNTVTWKPTKAGTFQVRVQVKNKLSKKSYDSQRVIDYTIFSPASLKTVSFNKVSPQPKNTSVTITAQSNDNANNLFKFLVFDGSKWVTVQDFSTKRTAAWKPTKAGAYQIKVQVKHKHSKKSYDSQQVSEFTVFDEASIKTVSFNNVSPQPNNTSITVTAESNDDANNLFKFLVFDGSTWITLQDFSTKRTAAWKPAEAGAYQVKVQVKHKLSKKGYDSQQVSAFTVFNEASLLSIDVDKSSPQPSNTEIKFTAQSKVPTEHLYRFSIFDGTQWLVVQDYSQQSYYNWLATTPGTFTIKTDVKHRLSKKEIDDSQEINFTIE
ncbi:L,D-transpeptidase family protein [Anaerobacillus sp. CMMVII]|uniref:triple tyrosine motif-containing protein n=1 Tax=Anaerobacillus sp. CMMVII TaxID=2755588 RepID=UPI0021C4CF8E|nr:triple tyrosine motif-containing protein [Anaerobacillus sp. CMMVII]MCT8140025.1 L,D-transpeptidase family protein [Anaerobacillus sp. CMMVII]